MQLQSLIQMQSLWSGGRTRAVATALCLSLLLVGCGGGGGGGSSGGGTGGSTVGGTGGTTPATPTDRPTEFEASRFLTQATYGPNSDSITELTTQGYSNWFTSQFAVTQTLHKNYMDQISATLTTGQSLNQNNFFETYWQQAISGNDQLRQRVAFALSEIFVISFVDGTVNQYPRGVASYYDMLATNAFGNFRTLLNDVTLHPMMGIYLTSIRNQKEATNRVPDENYAREVMQLFTLGLFQLNNDGSRKLDVNGQPIPTYDNTDISGLAKVMTGFSWAGPDTSNTRFGGGGTQDPNRDVLPMQAYPQYHSISAKVFLGTTIPAQTTATAASTMSDLNIALDTLFNHPNVGPFIGKQLIQRLVTSNPSPAYIQRVATVFNNNGNGVRGDMRVVIRAVLMDTEARDMAKIVEPSFGKLREPVVRQANWMRAFKSTSQTGRFLLTSTDDPISQLAQTQMRSSSVFNFFRPGYVPPGTSLANAGLVGPELQITSEASVVGYLNYMRSLVSAGAGSTPAGSTTRDVQPNYTTEIGLATDADPLIDRINLLLLYGQMSSSLRSQIRNSVNSITIPAATATNAATIDAARKNRVYNAVFLTLASPEFIAQK